MIPLAAVGRVRCMEEAGDRLSHAWHREVLRNLSSFPQSEMNLTLPEALQMLSLETAYL